MRAGGAVAAALLAIAATVLPGALLTAQPAAASSVSASQPAAASQAARTSQTVRTSQAKAPVTLAITGMSPLWASPGQTITVHGTLTNSSGNALSDPAVQLSSSTIPINGLYGLSHYSEEPGYYGTNPVGATWQSKASVAAGGSVSWSIRLPVKDIGMTTFGVYPLTAQATIGGLAASAQTYLPYEPAKKGPDSGSRPAPVQVAWVWPLVDQPILGRPYQNLCSDQQAQTLANSLKNGRLDALLTAGAGGGLASRDRVTWAIDPALLANVQAISDCTADPAEAKAAAGWLKALRSAITGQRVLTTSYADVDMAALVAGGYDSDAYEAAFSQGPTLAASVLGSKKSLLTGATWLPDGAVSDSLVFLHAKLALNTVLLQGGSMRAAHSSVVRISGVLGNMTALLANDAVTGTLSGAGTGTAFSTSQLFLAETAELAATHPGQPIIVAPPQRWQPSASLATDLLSETAAAPWLHPASLPTVAAAKHMPTVSPPQGRKPPVGLTKMERQDLPLVDQWIEDIQGFQENPNASLWLGAAALESSDWSGPHSGAAAEFRTEFNTVQDYAIGQGVNVNGHSDPGVEIVASKRDTIGGLKGSVPVSIYNKLGYAVEVRLTVHSVASDFSVSLPKADSGPITIPKNSVQQVKLHVVASQVGADTVTVQLWSAGSGPEAGQLMSSPPATMTVEATQFGTLAIIILAVALGVFLLASAARTVRRGRVQQTAEPGGAQTDNVVAERTGLGTAGKSGL